MISNDLSVPMDSANPGFWGSGDLDHGQRAALRRLIYEYNAGDLTLEELLDGSYAIRGFGQDQLGLPLEF